MSGHPDWLAVGQRVQVVCWFSTGGLDRVQETTVIRHTRTQVVIASGDRFHEVRGRYVETPKYLGYTSVLAPLTSIKGGLR